jgi:hypothetical protein
MHRAIAFDLNTPEIACDVDWRARVPDGDRYRSAFRRRVLADQLASALLEHARALVCERIASIGSAEHRAALEEKARFGRRVRELEMQLQKAI